MIKQLNFVQIQNCFRISSAFDMFCVVYSGKLFIFDINRVVIAEYSDKQFHQAFLFNSSLYLLADSSIFTFSNTFTRIIQNDLIDAKSKLFSVNNSLYLHAQNSIYIITSALTKIQDFHGFIFNFNSFVNVNERLFKLFQEGNKLILGPEITKLNAISYQMNNFIVSHDLNCQNATVFDMQTGALYLTQNALFDKYHIIDNCELSFQLQPKIQLLNSIKFKGRENYEIKIDTVTNELILKYHGTQFEFKIKQTKQRLEKIKAQIKPQIQHVAGIMHKEITVSDKISALYQNLFKCDVSQ
ncbi:Hypothetical_protein [Hexamita inflata]|uniref:Hypothetical_protein n=1 Tax=Hexamita inflata TaxID=28002 RepID=A0AA86Q1L6_9EUKA|nr:Hypothetical protein HINF_LOCUS37821 [Hexamita inflata]